MDDWNDPDTWKGLFLVIIIVGFFVLSYYLGWFENGYYTYGEGN